MNSTKYENLTLEIAKLQCYNKNITKIVKQLENSKKGKHASDVEKGNSICAFNENYINNNLIGVENMYCLVNNMLKSLKYSQKINNEKIKELKIELRDLLNSELD